MALLDPAVRLAIALMAAVLGLIALLLLPGRASIEEGRLGAYAGRGKWAVFIIGLLVLGAATILGYEWYRFRSARDPWVSGNVVLFALLGMALLIGNLWTMRYVKRMAGTVELVEAGAVEFVDAEGPPAGQVTEQADVEPPSPPTLGPVEPPAENAGDPKN